MVNKLYRCNEKITMLKEWCIAPNKSEAYKFMDMFWDDGAIMDEMYVNEFFKENPDKKIEDFIEIMFVEEDINSDFTHPYYGENDTPVTKKVSEWIAMADEVPMYLCHESWF